MTEYRITEYDEYVTLFLNPINMMNQLMTPFTLSKAPYPIHSSTFYPTQDKTKIVGCTKKSSKK